jgi:O-acetyl-ADP-ribose deacetylase (regulator of RNase III)
MQSMGAKKEKKEEATVTPPEAVPGGKAEMPSDPGNGSMIHLMQGDITKLELDAIVNAANQTLLGGGGVDGSIHRAAGRELLEACLALPETSLGVRCPTGEARITPGFNLPAKNVIHTVGPVYRDGLHGEPEKLAACYRNSLALAAANGCRTIAFPCISTGVYGYPIEPAALIAIREVRAFLASPAALPGMEVTFCTFSVRDISVYTRLLAAGNLRP